jgi:hypothetical protein
MNTCQIHICFLWISFRPQSGRSCPTWKLTTNKKTSVVGKWGQWFSSVWDLERLPLNFFPQQTPLSCKEVRGHLSTSFDMFHPVTFKFSDTFPVSWSEHNTNCHSTNCPWIWLWLTHQRSDCKEKAKTEQQHWGLCHPDLCHINKHLLGKQRISPGLGSELKLWQWLPRALDSGGLCAMRQVPTSRTPDEGGGRESISF